MPVDLSFLGKPERRTAAMAMAAGALLWLGWKAHDLIGDAQAAEARVTRLERRVERTERGVTRLLVHAGLPPDLEPDEAPIRSTGVGR